GLRQHRLAHDCAAAPALAARIASRQFAACPEGQRMAAALIQMMQHELPGNLFDHVPALLLRYLLGDSPADMLAVAPGHIDQLLTLPLRLAAHVTSDLNHDSALLSRIHELFSRALIQGIILVERQGKQIPFTIPTELLQTWPVH